LKLADSTFVLYMSDNGAGGGKRGGLRGGKGGVWEGGIRVPLIVRGPGVAANSWCHTRVVGYDLLPTFCAWAGIAPNKLPRQIEGGSLVNLIGHQGKGEVKRPREELVFHFPHYQSEDGPQSAIMLGDLKLIKFYETNSVSLFNLANDLGERNDLAAKMPEQAKQLQQRLEQDLVAINAQLPTVNPDYNPNQPADASRGKGGGGKKGNPKKGKPGKA